ncbi:MAG TPA: PilZ domain-containing protein [Vicinamibacterales bacterium]|jgi:c-di-GMP-binding flagellar brake protein YcgR
MAEAFLERRRAPRISFSNDHRIGLPLSLTVRLVDISAGGVLISSTQPMTVGQRARLHTTLGAEPFTVEVEVRRVADAGADANGSGRYRMGAAFTALDSTARRSMEHLFSGEVQ